MLPLTLRSGATRCSAAERFLARSPLNACHEVANINFVQTSGAADLQSEWQLDRLYTAVNAAASTPQSSMMSFMLSPMMLGFARCRRAAVRHSVCDENYLPNVGRLHVVDRSARLIGPRFRSSRDADLIGLVAAEAMIGIFTDTQRDMAVAVSFEGQDIAKHSAAVRRLPKSRPTKAPNADYQPPLCRRVWRPRPRKARTTGSSHGCTFLPNPTSAAHARIVGLSLEPAASTVPNSFRTSFSGPALGTASRIAPGAPWQILRFKGDLGWVVVVGGCHRECAQ